MELKLRVKFSLAALSAAILALSIAGILERVFVIPGSVTAIIAIFILTVLIFVAFLKIVIKPIKKLNSFFASLTTITKEGAEKVVLEEVDIKLGDGFEELASGFNRFVICQKKLINQMSKGFEKLSFFSESLTTSTQQINASIQEVSSAIQQIAKGASTQSERLVKINETIGRISNSTEETSANINTTAAFSEQILKNIQLSKEFSQEMVVKMDKVLSVSKDSINKNSALKESSETITIISETISKIADQTNLLALNAAIEAARAGEAGRGFAVVAEEIRKLAGNTADSVKRIGDTVKKIQHGINEVVEATQVSNEQINEGRQVSNRVKAALEEISKLIAQMVGVTRIISEVSQKQLDSIKSTFKDIGDVSLISQNSASACQETSSSVEEQTASMQEMASTSQELSRHVSELKDLLARIRL